MIMIRSVTATVMATAVLCGVIASAQDKTIVLRAARMFDGREIQTPGVVLVSGAAIVGVGASAQIPAGAQVIDMGEATISPGFIDAHTHLSAMYTPDYKQGLIDSFTKAVPEQTLLAFVRDDRSKK